MIIDTIDNLPRYFALDERFKTAAEELKKLPYDMEEGKYPVSGDTYLLFQIRNTGELKEGSFETHNKYIDLQVVLEGEEMLSAAGLSELAEQKAYDEEKDIAFFKGKDYALKVSAGMFYVMYPGEAHKCCCHTTPGLPLKKAVFKIRA